MATRVGKKVTAKKARELLASEPAAKQVANEYGSMYVLADGQALLLFEDGAGMLYPSREAYEQLMGWAKQEVAKGPQDPKLDLLPPAAQFLANVAERAAHPPAKLVPSLAGDEKDFEAIDGAVLGLPRAARLAPELVTWLVAFVGEYMRKTTNGRWSTVENAGSPEPIVVTPGGRMLQPFAVVYLELIRGKQGSIRGALRGAMVGL